MLSILLSYLMNKRGSPLCVLHRQRPVSSVGPELNECLRLELPLLKPSNKSEGRVKKVINFITIPIWRLITELEYTLVGIHI